MGELADIEDENGSALPPVALAAPHLRSLVPGKQHSTENIAMVIGDNVATVAKHYSTWIQGRQETLTNMMKAALTPRAQAATTGR